MIKTSEELEREVETSRGTLDRTVDALKAKMTPGQIFDEASHAMGGAGKEVFAKFVAQASENPMPLAVMGLGLAWLMTSNNRKSSPTSSYGTSQARLQTHFDEAASHGIADKVHVLGDKASDLVSGAKDKITSTGSSAADAGRAAAHNLGEMASSAADKASDYGLRAQPTFKDVLQREPLIIGALGLVVGAAIGAAMPSTSAEDQAVGAVRDHLLEQGKDFAHDALEQASDAAQAALGAVKSELKDSSDDTDIAHRADGVARAGVQAAKGALHDGSAH